MPIEITRDDVTRRFVAVASGPLMFPEALAFLSTHRVGPYQQYALLFDARDATLDALSSADVRQLGHEVGSIAVREGPRGRTAIVTREGAPFGVARMFATGAESAGGVTIHVFHDLQAALEWLGDAAGQ